MLRHGILGLLDYGDMTGYEIMVVFRESLSHFWTAQTSQIYRELQTLEKNGWIRSTHVAQEGRPDKNILSITEDGRSELGRWLRDDDKKANVRLPFLMKTFFRGECGIDENIRYFRSLAEELSVFPKGSDRAFRAVEQYGKLIDDPEKALYWKFTVEFGLMYEEMVRSWCDRCIDELEGMRRESTPD